MKISWVETHRLAAGGIPIGMADLESLRSQGIQAIVSLTEHPLTVQKELDDEIFKQLGLEVHHISVVDRHPPDIQQVVAFATLINRLRAEGKPAYFHCHAGIGRTGTMDAPCVLSIAGLLT